MQSLKKHAVVTSGLSVPCEVSSVTAAWLRSILMCLCLSVSLLHCTGFYCNMDHQLCYQTISACACYLSLIIIEVAL